MRARKLSILIVTLSSALIAVLLFPAPATIGAGASLFHFMKIVEVFPGATVEPAAQYIEMQMYVPSQNFVASHEIFIYDNAGIKIDSFVFAASLPNGANQASILIATVEAEAFFSITADLVMTPSISLEGGKICFEDPAIDCVSWGNYSGSAVGTGTPFNAPDGFRLGEAVHRDLGGDGILQAFDDTGDSDADFDFGVPAPRNNANATGTLPSSTCGNGLLEGLEQCDDGNTTPGDGCDANCQIELPECGNGIVEDGEECDDGNTTPGDGCDGFCQFEPVCGNNILEPGEGCDDGNTTPGDGCDESCQPEGGCLVTMTGDVDVNGTITSSDIIVLVNYVFKSGSVPEPCEAAGDANCSGDVTSSDIIFLVNHVFKSGPLPCDVCSLVPGSFDCSSPVWQTIFEDDFDGNALDTSNWLVFPTTTYGLTGTGNLRSDGDTADGDATIFVYDSTVAGSYVSVTTRFRTTQLDAFEDDVDLALYLNGTGDFYGFLLSSDPIEGVRDYELKIFKVTGGVDSLLAGVLVGGVTPQISGGNDYILEGVNANGTLTITLQDGNGNILKSLSVVDPTPLTGGIIGIEGDLNVDMILPQAIFFDYVIVQVFK